jgi:hypothetical protein
MTNAPVIRPLIFSSGLPIKSATAAIGIPKLLPSASRHTPKTQQKSTAQTMLEGANCTSLVPAG